MKINRKAEAALVGGLGGSGEMLDIGGLESGVKPVATYADFGERLDSMDRTWTCFRAENPTPGFLGYFLWKVLRPIRLRWVIGGADFAFNIGNPVPFSPLIRVPRTGIFNACVHGGVAASPLEMDECVIWSGNNNVPIAASNTTLAGQVVHNLNVVVQPGNGIAMSTPQLNPGATCSVELCFSELESTRR